MKTLYYKKQGRRYVPVSEYDSELLDSFPKGDHLVSVYPGGSSRRYNINPDYAAMIAAGRVAEDAVCSAIIKAQELRPSTTPITEEQQRLWRSLAHSFNQDEYGLIRPAARDAAKAAVRAMQAEADKLLNNPTVRKAYERFLLVAELCKDTKNERI